MLAGTANITQLAPNISKQGVSTRGFAVRGCLRQVQREVKALGRGFMLQK